MADLADKIDYAQFLHDGSEILYQGKSDVERIGTDNSDNVVTFRIPTLPSEIIDPVIEVFLK